MRLVGHDPVTNGDETRRSGSAMQLQTLFLFYLDEATELSRKCASVSYLEEKTKQPSEAVCV